MTETASRFAPPKRQPPVGIDPQDIYNPSMAPFTNPTEKFRPMDLPKPKHKYQSVNVETPGTVYGAVYSGVPVYEMMCRNVAVMRRQKDSFLNATQVLKVAQIEKGKRTKILEKEIQNRDHEKVQGGYGKYQGTWIPFERGLDLAKLYGVEGLLRPLLEYMPPNGRSERTPTKEQVLGNINSRSTTSNQQNRKATGTYQHSTEKRMKFEHAQETVDEHSNSLHNSTDFRDAQFVNDVSLTTDHFFDFHDAKNYYNPYMSGYYMDPYMHAYPHSMPPPTQSPVALAATEPSSERHRSTIMSFFLNTNDRHDSILLHSSLPPDFDIDLVLDDQGHTALHWAAALANINLLTQLIQKSAQIDRLNFSGESALLRSVMVAHNHERQTFLDLLTVLKDIICIPDKKNRTVLHHICLAASSKGKLQTSIYYMQCLLEFIAKSAYDEAMSSQLVHSDNQVSLSRRFATLLNVSDFCGDTAVNIAARLGNRQLVDQLVEAGADLTIPNYIGLRPYDFGLQYQNEQKSMGRSASMEMANPNSSCIVYPSIQNENEAFTSNHTPILNMNEKTQTEIVAELQQQLIAMSRELTEYRKEIDPLRKENATIPELKSRVHSLEKKALEHQINISQSFATVPNGSPDTSSMDDEVNRLRLALAHQKAVEAHLCQELVSLRSTLGNHELSCKKIISACCNVPLQHVEELLQPLLEALESDDFNLDMTLITNFLAKIRSENATTSNVPSEYAESTNSFMM